MLTDSQRVVYSTAAELRAAIRAGRYTAATAGQAPGFVQTNLVILPAADAADFARFCRENDRPCPLDRADRARATSSRAARRRDADLRTDVPRYRVFREGVLQAGEPTDIRDLWRDDLVGFLIGCSFTFETALIGAGLGVRHIEEGRNVPMYRTSVPCRPAGKFAGPLVVSMRPYLPEQIRAGDRDHWRATRRCTERPCTWEIRPCWASPIWPGRTSAMP